ncbi:hypothetical protein GCM10008934_20950 [Virgibacillus salarius]|uniref:hypothetical protein n=1 Tax=Virgibacillus salarius TaxID=447199 RepID=UPI0031D1EEAC
MGKLYLMMKDKDISDKIIEILHKLRKISESEEIDHTVQVVELYNLKQMIEKMSDKHAIFLSDCCSPEFIKTVKASSDTQYFLFHLDEKPATLKSSTNVFVYDKYEPIINWLDRYVFKELDQIPELSIQENKIEESEGVINKKETDEKAVEDVSIYQQNNEIVSDERVNDIKNKAFRNVSWQPN